MTDRYYVGPEPVIVGSSALPAGASTEATLASIDAKTPSMSGGATPVTGTVAVSGSVAVTGPATDAQLRATPLPVSGTVSTGGLTDAQLRASAVPVSLSSVPSHNVTNAGTFAVQAAQSGTWVLGANSGVDIGDVTINNASGASAVNIQDGGNSITVDGTVGISGSVAVTGTFWQATQPVSGTVAATQSGTWTATPPALTIGTNSANGFTVQSTCDAGRTPVRYYAVAAAAGATTVETAISLTRSSGNSATSAAVSWTITNGKRFRIQAITFATRGHNTATAQVTTFNFRVNTAGAVTTASTPIELAVRCATPATANSWDRVFVQIPDGWEITGDGTLQFGVTAAATYVTNAPTWDVTIIGFEY